MAEQMPAWFIHAVSETVQQLAQQKQSKVMGAVRMKTGVVGKTWPFNRIAFLNLTEVTTRDGDTQYLNPPQSKRRAILRDFTGYVLIDEFDEVKTLTSPQSEFSQILAYALNRQYDDLTIGIAGRTAAGAAGTATGGILGKATTVDENAETTAADDIPAAQQIVNGGTNLTVAKVISAKKLLDEADVEEEDRYFFYSPAGMAKLLADTNVTSSDFNTIKALAGGGFPMDQTWMGFKWRSSTRLPKTGNIRSCIAFQRNAAGLAVGLVKDAIVSDAPHKNNNTQVGVKLSAGTVRVDDKGVAQVDIDESA
jgi:Phage capsid protein